MKNEQESSSKAVAVVEQHENANIQIVDLTNGHLPDLHKAEVIPLDLTSEYWTPETPGETKRMIFVELKERQVEDFNDPNILVDLVCAAFVEQDENGQVKSVTNGSKRLVAAIENNNIKRGTPLQITFLGKKKNKKNNFHSDNWSVKPLRIAI